MELLRSQLSGGLGADTSLWKFARESLLAAMGHVGDKLRYQEDEEASIKDVESFIEEEEYVLAIEEFFAVGVLNDFKKDFWKSLLSAAEAMKEEPMILKINSVLKSRF